MIERLCNLDVNAQPELSFTKSICETRIRLGLVYERSEKSECCVAKLRSGAQRADRNLGIDKV